MTATQKYSLKMLPEQDSRSRTFYWLIVFLLAIALLTGGSSRGDVQSLVILRPVAVICCGIGLWSIRADDFRNFRFVLALAIGFLFVAIMYLIPLPAEYVSGLSGHSIIREIDAHSDLSGNWRPISMAPLASFNALSSLSVPMAVLLIGIQLNKADQYRLLPVLIVLGLLSGVMGFVQAISPGDGPTYLYRITNFGASVGFFANRNHQAFMLAICPPMLAVLATSSLYNQSNKKITRIFCLAFAVITIPLLSITGSRAGILIGISSIFVSIFIYQFDGKSKLDSKKTNSYLNTILFVLIVMLLALFSVIFARAEAVDRLFVTDASSELRFQFWPIALQAGYDYFPIGSGLGSFVSVFNIVENNNSIAHYYINHAHNEYIEFFIEGGIIVIFIFLLSLILFLKKIKLMIFSKIKSGTAYIFEFLAIVLIVFFVFSSFVDYPLRVPFLASVFMICVIWLVGKPSSKTQKVGAL